jgi:anti-sigma B factor antagonist
LASPRPYPLAPPEGAPMWELVGDGVTASVAGYDGTVIATITRTVESPAALAGVDGPLSVVTVDGDIDQDTAPLLEQALRLAINDRLRTCLDMRRVDFFGAAGVHVLMAAQGHAASLRHCFVLRGVHGIANQVLAIVGLDRLITMID